MSELVAVFVTEENDISYGEMIDVKEEIDPLKLEGKQLKGLMFFLLS